MRFADLRHIFAARALSRALANGRLAHAYLFAGPAGLGQGETARALAAAALCPRREGGDACGECLACRKTRAGNHPDLHWVRPEDAFLKRHQVGDVLRGMIYRPLEGRRRCAVLEECQRLTPEAANYLLKVLEEPPPHALTILLAEDAALLPETVVSRCQRVPFRQRPLAEVAAGLREETDLSEPAARSLAGLAGGNPGRARELLERGALAGMRRAVLEALRRTGGGDPLEALAAAGELAAFNGQDLLTALDLLGATLRDVWLFTQRAPLRYALQADAHDEIARLAEIWDGFDYAAAAVQVVRARQRLDAYVQARGALEVLLLGLQRLRREGGCNHGSSA